MIVPAPVIIVIFLAVFVLATWQYVLMDPARRILNVRFMLAVSSVAAVLYYAVHIYYYPDDRPTSWWFGALSVIWLAWAWLLLRRMPAREQD